MRGWKAILTDPAAEPYLNDLATTDEHGDALFAPGANRDGIVGWSYGLLDVDLLIRGSLQPIEGYRQSGWLAFA